MTLPRGAGGVLGIAAALAASAAAGRDIFVDGSLSAGRIETYSPERRDGSGTAAAVRSLSAVEAGPGDTVIVRGGVYPEMLRVRTSGEEGRPVTFRSYRGETATIAGASIEPAIDLSGRSHVVIEGIRVEKVRRWLYARGTTRCVLRGCVFREALDPGGSSKTGLFFQGASENRIEGCEIVDSTQDSIALIDSHRNVVEGNRVARARHALWTIKCGSRNVIRGNRFHNELQKIGEVLDCEDVGFDHEIRRFDAAARNLIEGNEFAFTPSSGNRSPYAGIQFAGQGCIIRRNRFHHTVGPGLDLTLYPEEALHVHGNRICHNVFAASDHAGVALAAGKGFGDNVLANNVLFGSRFVANDRRWPWFVETLAGKPVQLLTAGLDGFRLERNAFSGGAPGERWLVVLGRRDSTSNPPPRSLAEWERDRPDLFRGNIEADPKLGDDFRPRTGSPLVDSGAFLARARAAGSGDRLPVDDAAWFWDGAGIPGERGDRIRLEGGPAAAVVSVDLGANEIVLDAPLAWEAGEGVSLDFAGSAPDIGAFEAGR